MWAAPAAHQLGHSPLDFCPDIPFINYMWHIQDIGLRIWICPAIRETLGAQLHWERNTVQTVVVAFPPPTVPQFRGPTAAAEAIVISSPYSHPRDV